jgi:hypothetical protein
MSRPALGSLSVDFTETENAMTTSTPISASFASSIQQSTDASDPPAATPSRAALRTGRVLSGVAVAFLLFDASLKLFAVAPAVKGTVELGYPPSSLFTLAVIQLICLVAYVVPSTAVLGALLWTGYLGGAVATHFRVGNPLFSHTLFPLYVAALLWGGLWLRDRRVRALLPLRTKP